MDHFANPATLAGLIMCVAIAAWAVGRWQALVAGQGGDPALTGPTITPRTDATATQSLPALCQQDASGEGLRALEGGLSLGELHAEVTAFRQRERVLATIPPESLRFDRPSVRRDQACRIGLTGMPICPVPGAAQGACREYCGDRRMADPPRPKASASQPAPEPSSFTRV